MVSEIAVHSLSAEFWAVIGSAVTLLMALIGIAALNLTVAGWLREDIRSVDARVNGLETRLSGEIKTLDAKLSGKIYALDTNVALIDKRLAVVESHVLATRPSVDGERSEKAPAR